MNVAFDLYELGILTKPSYLLVLHPGTNFQRNYLLRDFLFEDMKTNNTFQKFKNYTKVNIPHLYDLVNSMGEYYKFHKINV